MKLSDYIVALHINAMTDNLPQRRRGLVLLVSKQAKPVAHFFEPSVTKYCSFCTVYEFMSDPLCPSGSVSVETWTAQIGYLPKSAR